MEGSRKPGPGSRHQLEAAATAAVPGASRRQVAAGPAANWDSRQQQAVASSASNDQLPIGHGTCFGDTCRGTGVLDQPKQRQAQ